MNASRIAPIPFGHVLAELVAFPLASEAGLSLGLTTLRPDMVGDTQTLWRAAERTLAASSPAISLDELISMRDDLWFLGCPSDGQPLSKYLRHIASRFLAVQGDAVVPRLELGAFGGLDISGECSARSFWRWLSLALPPDLLLAALGQPGQCASSVETVSPLLRRRLEDDGLAETHLHLNASFNFDAIWVSALRGLAETGNLPGKFAGPGALFNEGEQFASWLLHAAIARYVLAGYLRHSEAPGGFQEYLDEVTDRFQAENEPSLAVLLYSSLDALYRGSLEKGVQFTTLHFLYRFLIGSSIGPLPEYPEDVWAEDPIWPLLGGPDTGVSSAEVAFVTRALHHLERPKEDSGFAGLFWQVIRVRCLFYRHLVQRPMTPGLQWFIRFFNRLWPARSILDRPRLKGRSAARLCGADRGLRSLELRITPKSALSTLYAEVRDLDESLQASDPAVERSSTAIEFGIVFHFLRDRGGGWLDGKPTAHWAGSYADPEIKVDSRNPTTGYRYGMFYKERRREAQAAAGLLSFFPRSLEIVRGLDLCTDEAGVPTWVMAPLLRYVRDAGNVASSRLRKIHPLRTTVHAGEDFVHLMSGLRRLDESLDYLGLAEGDRLGHALSLGVDPKVWVERAGRVAQAREERLFDLVWEWSWYARQGQGVSGGRQALIQREVAEHTREIFGRERTPWQMTQLIRDLHDEKILRYLGFPDGHPPEGSGEEYELVCLYLTNPQVFAHGRQIIWIDPTGDLQALQHLQAGLRRKVGQMGLTIEVNPSSNLLIGHLGEMGRHPLWRLAPVNGNEDDIPPLSVCIGSDDPLTFATTLPEEYQLLYDALIQNGCSEAMAHGWLERARKAGMSARFTLPESRLAQHEDDFRYTSAGFPDLDLPP